MIRKILVLLLVACISYFIGYGQGQSSFYEKVKNDKALQELKYSDGGNE